MAKEFEADVAFLHVAGGGARNTPPPGTHAQTAPRRAARGRRGDMLFISVGLPSPKAAPPSIVEHLARLVAQAYFGTPGSVTFALREAAAALNDQILDTNQAAEEDVLLEAHMMVGVLREDNLYVAQCGVGQAILVRPGQVSRLTSEDAASRPLGTALTPYVRFHHLEVNPGDLFILTTSPPPIWSDTTLSGLSGLDPAQAVDRLSAASNRDLTGLLARVVAYGETTTPLQPSAATPPVEVSPSPAAPTRAKLRRRSSAEVARRTVISTGQFITNLRRVISEWLTSVIQVVTKLLVRMAPGIVEPPQTGAFPPSLLVATAVAVPLIVVSIAAAVYFGRGRRQQFQAYLSEAASAVRSAQAVSDLEAAREDWEAAIRFLNLAASYGRSKEADELRQIAQEAVDALDLVVRLEFRQVVSGGFGPDAQITALAASATDLYVLDTVNVIVRHAWGAPERGFEIDKSFECLNGPDSFPDMETPVDIVVQAQPSALGVEGIVVVDQDGTLLYCAPDRTPAFAQLTPPDVGWGRIDAIDVFGESLYVMDTENNAVYIYDATGGLFSGTPNFYFVEDVPDLSGAIDLAMAQEELFILYADGRLDRCRRETIPEGGSFQIRVECDEDLRFQDDRPGYEATTHIPGAIPVQMAYSPPPEPSLFFLDTFSNRVFHYSMRLVYQGQYLPVQPFDSEVTALTLGPPNDLFVAVGDQVYHALPVREADL